MSIILFDRLGTKLVNADTIIQGKSIALRGGRNEVCLRLEQVHLTPGVYTLGLFLAHHRLIFDFVQSAAQIEVVQPGYRRLWHEADPGWLRHLRVLRSVRECFPAFSEGVSMSVPLSVIVPTYNRATLLPECVRSIRDCGVGDVEIVVVDDGSTDDTAAVVVRWATKSSTSARPMRARRRPAITASLSAAADTSLSSIPTTAGCRGFVPSSSDCWTNGRVDVGVENKPAALRAQLGDDAVENAHPADVDAGLVAAAHAARQPAGEHNGDGFRWRHDHASTRRLSLEAASLYCGHSTLTGGVAEWLKAHAWKACIRETVSWVRIPLPPPHYIDFYT